MSIKIELFTDNSIYDLRGFFMLVVFHVQPDYVEKLYLNKVIKKIKEYGISNCLIINDNDLINFDKLDDLQCKTLSTEYHNFGWLLNLQVQNDKIDRELIFDFLSKYQSKELNFEDNLVLKVINHLKSIKNELQDDDLEEQLVESLQIFRNSLNLIEQIPNNSIIIGGSLTACLVELELGLLFLDKNYKILLDLCYKG